MLKQREEDSVDAEEEMDEAEEENDEAEEDLHQIEQSDAEEKEGEEEEEEEEGLDDDWACVNCPVWALRYGKRLPAVICDFQQIPIERQSLLKTKKQGMVYIHFVGIDKYSVCHKSKLIKMSNTPQDMMFAEGNLNYQLAMSFA